MSDPGFPLAILAELTHRCPLQCPYCSNPLALEAASAELSTDEWKRAIAEAAELGALQIHFSGGEPTARRDLEALVARSEEHTSELQSLMRISYAVFCLKKKKQRTT